MSVGPSGLPTISEEEKGWVEVWEKAEDVAMHFNELIMNFRLRALGAVTIAVGLIGTILLTKEGVAPERHNFLLATVAMSFLAVAWLAILAVDLGYYSRLLRGAVNELQRLEAQSGGIINLSTEIEKVAKGRCFSDRHARGLFYVLPLVALVGVAVFAFLKAPPG